MMTKASQTPDLKNFYRLPFEDGTFKLTEQTLNLHSEFRKPHFFYRTIIRNVHFRNEILTLGVKPGDEPEMLVFLKVTQHELLVSCNVDTDPTYLSRYAYLGLLSLMDYRSSVSLRKFFWPGFFALRTGKSKFLEIYNDRQGLDIFVKPRFPHFYRPGDELIDWYKGSKNQELKLAAPPLPDEAPPSNPAIGYFIADVQLNSIHSNHYPFLVPFIGIPTKDKQRIKSYSSIWLSENDVPSIDITPIQQHLNAICFKMRELAPVESRQRWRYFSITAEEKENESKLMELWHEAKHLIQSQKYIYYYYTHGLNYLRGKPKRDWIHHYSIRDGRPQLVIKRIDKGEYYQFELKFRVNRKLYVPVKSDIAFFINGTADPQSLYLLNQFTDYQLVWFFGQYGHKLAVLKCHYPGGFENFVDRLAEHYELIAC
jgi:hypothetical protein